MLTITILVTQLILFKEFVKANKSAPSEKTAQFNGYGCFLFMSIPADVFIVWLVIEKFL